MSLKLCVSCNNLYISLLAVENVPYLVSLLAVVFVLAAQSEVEHEYEERCGSCEDHCVAQDASALVEFFFQCVDAWLVRLAISYWLESPEDR